MGAASSGTNRERPSTLRSSLDGCVGERLCDRRRRQMCAPATVTVRVPRWQIGGEQHIRAEQRAAMAGLANCTTATTGAREKKPVAGQVHAAVLGVLPHEAQECARANPAHLRNSVGEGSALPLSFRLAVSVSYPGLPGTVHRLPCHASRSCAAPAQRTTRHVGR